MRFIYKPFGLILGILAGLIAKKLFDRLWGLVDDEEPPKPTTQTTSWPKTVGAAALEGAVFKGTRAAIDRAGATGYERLTGVWPGERAPEKTDD